jgi:threonylcarbamoyladenosine tRNA methylthiotransferase MtaB
VGSDRDAPPSPRVRVAFRTFGCKLNLYETAGIRQNARGRFALVDTDADADVVVVNTCSVTARADQEARQYVRSVHRRRPQARLVVTGCYAQRAPDELAALPGVALVAGHAEKDVLHRLLESLPPAGDPPRIAVGGLDGKPMTTLRAVGLDGRTRALLRVQDGCDAACTYCVIPSTRGRSRSLLLEEALDEARRILDAGFRELVVTGTHLGHYGIDLAPRRTLSDLVEGLLGLDAPHAFRVRLSSVEPQEIDGRLIEMLAGGSRLAPHLHLPLQSGSDALLRAMRRSYRTPAYRKQVRAVAARVHPLALGADLIVGFPGETEGDFRRTLRLLAELPFTYIHPFTYSPRPGTPAASWTTRPPGDMASRRLVAARALVERKNLEFRRARVGERVRVLVEETNAAGESQGLCETYLRVTFNGYKHLAGRFALVNVTGLNKDGLVGRLLEGEPDGRSAA